MTTRARWERVTSDAGVATLAWPYDPVPKLEIAVVGPTHAGGALRVHVDYCKATGYTPIEVRWALIDGVTIILPPTMVTLPVGCRVTTFILPSSPHMTPGRYQLRVNGLYQTWPWRTVIEEAISPVFEVVP
jgi:hypothetical protein